MTASIWSAKSLSPWSLPSSRCSCTPGIPRHHLAPVQHLVALGGQQVIALRQRRSAAGQGPQFVDETGLEHQPLRRVMPGRMLAHLRRQVARRMNRRVEQHRLAPCSARPARWHKSPPSEEPITAIALARPVADTLLHHVHGLARRHRQLRTPPGHGRMLSRDPLAPSCGTWSIRARSENRAGTARGWCESAGTWRNHRHARQRPCAAAG